MLQLEHKKKLVDACYPTWTAEQEKIWRQEGRQPSALEIKKAWSEAASELWHDIKPVKFGNIIQWSEAVTELAAYQVPQDASYMIVLRVECYVTTFDAAAPAFGQFSPPPSGNAFWGYTEASAATPERISPTLPIHIFCDSDEFLFAKGDHRVTLLADLDAPPDGNARMIRTLVYGYLVGALVAGKIGDSESTYATIGNV